MKTLEAWDYSEGNHPGPGPVCVLCTRLEWGGGSKKNAGASPRPCTYGSRACMQPHVVFVISLSPSIPVSLQACIPCILNSFPSVSFPAFYHAMRTNLSSYVYPPTFHGESHFRFQFFLLYIWREETEKKFSLILRHFDMSRHQKINRE